MLTSGQVVALPNAGRIPPARTEPALSLPCSLLTSLSLLVFPIWNGPSFMLVACLPLP